VTWGSPRRGAGSNCKLQQHKFLLLRCNNYINLVNVHHVSGILTLLISACPEFWWKSQLTKLLYMSMRYNHVFSTLWHQCQLRTSVVLHRHISAVISGHMTHDTARRLCSTISLLFQPLAEISPIAVTISLHLPSATLPNTVLDLKVPLIVYKSWLITFLFNHWSETSNYKAMPQWHCIYLSVLTRVQKYDDYYSYLSKPKQN